MKAVSDADQLRSLVENTLFGNYIRWALHEITGESLPFPPAQQIPQAKWFLEPLADPKSLTDGRQPVPAPAGN
jgi:hypothetical protein